MDTVNHTPLFLFNPNPLGPHVNSCILPLDLVAAKCSAMLDMYMPDDAELDEKMRTHLGCNDHTNACLQPFFHLGIYVYNAWEMAKAVPVPYFFLA